MGDFGRTGNGGVYTGSVLEERNTINMPENAPLPGASHRGDIPFVVVGGAAFRMKTCLMQPYPGTNLTREKRLIH